jgi:tetratricopeptide (TPR) repeat protein
MLISNMSGIESRAFDEAYELAQSGEAEEAIRRLHRLAEEVALPGDKVAIMYYEALCLVESERILDARERFLRIQAHLGTIDEAGLDPNGHGIFSELKVLVSFLEAKLLIAEDNQSSALTILTQLNSEFRNDISSPKFGEIRNQVQMLLGTLLADAGRFEEAMPILDNATAPTVDWEGLLRFHRARCHYELSEYEITKVLLLEALKFALISKWKAWTHYLLGRTYYHLSDFANAKIQFELCLKISNNDFAKTKRVFEWLEATVRSSRSVTSGNVVVRPPSEKRQPS